jgi:Tfp pilus assembly PilM family ATPase
MLVANELLCSPLPQPFSRRFAAGIDLSPSEVRLVVLSRRTRREASVRVEWLGAVPLDRATMSGVEIVDSAAVSRAIAALFAEWPRRRATGLLACSMALPGSATLIDSIPMNLSPPDAGGAVSTDTLAELEPAVYAHAERVAGVERQALAVDWFVDESNRGCGPGGASSQRDGAARVMIAAAARRHLEARVEAAAAAGIALSAIDGEPPAALRALCYAAHYELRESERYAAVWVGGDGVYGWRIADGAVEAHVRYPAPQHPDLPAALRALTDGEELGCAMTGGDLELLAECGMTLADVGDLLGCTVFAFECASFLDANAHRRLGDAYRWAQVPTFAVAFGLALRGVYE